MSTFRTVFVEVKHSENAGWDAICELPEFMNEACNEYLLWKNPAIALPKLAGGDDFPSLPDDLSYTVNKRVSKGAWWVKTVLTPEQFKEGVRLSEQHPEECGRVVIDECYGALALADYFLSVGKEVRFIVLLDH